MTRRSVSLRGATYARLAAHCAARGEAVSAVVERLVAEHFDGKPGLVPHAAVVERHLRDPDFRAAYERRTSEVAGLAGLQVGQRWRKRRGMDRVVEIVRFSGPLVVIRTVGLTYCQFFHPDVLRRGFDPLPDEVPCPATAPSPTAATAPGCGSAPAPAASTTAPAAPPVASPPPHPQPLRVAPRRDRAHVPALAPSGSATGASAGTDRAGGRPGPRKAASVVQRRPGERLW